MSSRLPPQRVPTLTEVIEVSELDKAAETAAAFARPSEAELTERVLADVQRQVELMLEHRLREALMPALSRAGDALVLEVRTELASTLRELVSRAVAQAMAQEKAGQRGP